MTYWCLAGLLRAQGNYAGARLLYECALAIWEQVLGGENLNTKVVRSNLEGLLAEMQQPPE